jgi:hypothetical protein
MSKLIFAVVMATVGLAIIVGVANVSAANDHTVPPPDVFVDANPCTGLDTTITQTYSKAVSHFSMDANGGEHFTGTLVGTIETADGYSGRFTIWFGDNVSGDGEHSVSSFTFSSTLGNDSGQRIVIHQVGHVTFVDGALVVEIDNSSFECRGMPAA